MALDLNVARRLEHHASQAPERVALRFEHRSWTYGEVDDITTRIASGLAAIGVEPGDRVAVMMPNWPEFHFTTHGAWKAGAVEVPINIMYAADEVRYILGDAGATAVIASPEAARIIAEVSDDLPSLRSVVVVGSSDIPGGLSFDGLIGLGSPDAAIVEGDGDSLAVVAYTSGTTGFPKGAMLSHRNLIVSMESLGRYLGLSAHDNVLQVLPCFHSNASLIGIVFGWYLGSTSILVERFEPEEFVETVRATQPAFFAFVPTLLYDLSRATSASATSFSSVKYVTYGAAPCPPHVRHAVQGKFGLRLLQAYGMTEAPNVVTVDPLEGEIKDDAVGIPLPHMDIQIVDEEGRRLPRGESGEICIGPSSGHDGLVFETMLGYWRNPEATADALRDGYFSTGDIGVLDADGFLHIVDRKKDLIIRGGNNVFPAELERVLVSDPRVDEAYVIGVPHARLGEVPKAFIVLKKGAQATAQDLREVLSARLASYKRVEEFEFVTSDSLPRTALGKVLKRELRERDRRREETVVA